MGTSRTPTHRVEFLTDNGHWTPQGWPTKQAGRANGKNLSYHVRTLEQSTQPGGVNAHLGATRIIAARLLTNTGETKLVAGYLAKQANAQLAWLVRDVAQPVSADIFFYGDSK